MRNLTTDDLTETIHAGDRIRFTNPDPTRPDDEIIGTVEKVETYSITVSVGGLTEYTIDPKDFVRKLD